MISYNNVPNLNNFREYKIPTEDIPWYVANLLFCKKVVVDDGPLALSEEKAIELIRSDLFQYYE